MLRVSALPPAICLPAGRDAVAALGAGETPWVTAEDRSDIEHIGQLRVVRADGTAVPLSQLAEIRLEDGPAQTSRERGRRKITVETNVRGRDMASFVADAPSAVAARVPLPPGYSVVWAGQFQNLQEATARQVIVVPAALGLIFGLL